MTRISIGQANGSEGEETNHGGSEQRERGATHRGGGSLFRDLAFFDPRHHALGHDDSVIHQHSHGDHQGPQGDPLKFEGKGVHEPEGPHDRKEQDGAYHGAGAPAHKQAQGSGNGGNGNGQIHHKGIDRLLNHLVLLVNGESFDPHRQGAQHLLEPPFNRLSNGNDVFSLGYGHPKNENPFPIVTNELKGLL